MCFKKIADWFKPDPIIPPEYTGQTVTMFAINDYPGSSHDLRGCLTDLRRFKNNIFIPNYPELVIHPFRDNEVSKDRFLTTLEEYTNKFVPGDRWILTYSGHGTYGIDPYGKEEDGYSEALYLHDGTVWDYEIIDIVKNIPPSDHPPVFIFDSCFGGGSASRLRNKNSYFQNRFVQTQDIKPEVKRKRAFMDVSGMNYIVFAGAQEDQTAADAFIDEEYCGAFSHYAEATFDKTLTYTEWLEATKFAVNMYSFEQVPVLVCKDEYKDLIIFS